MMKKTIAICFIITFSIVLGGCWNYTEIESLIIVAGAAVDRSTDGKQYHVTIETIDLSGGGKEAQAKSALYEADGKTILDAVRNAKRIATTKFYWSNCQIIVLSEQIARAGLIPILDVFTRDNEPRGTMEVLVAKEASAKEILAQKGISSPIISFDIDKILETDHEFLSSTSYILLHNIFNTLAGSGRSLTLPTVQNVSNNQSKTPMVSGDAVFQKDKLVGFLTGDETKYSLFVKDEVKGGLITGEIEQDGLHPYSLEILSSHTDISHQFKDGVLTMKVKMKTNTALLLLSSEVDFIQYGARDTLVQNAQTMVEENVHGVIAMVQSKFDSDIFGFGEHISKSDPKLWKHLKNNWNETFKALQVEVVSDINIANSVFLKTPYKVGE